MNQIITIISCALAVASFLYSFGQSITFCCVSGALTLVLLMICFKVEDIIKTKGNSTINKILYYCSRDDKKYNYLCKQFTYSYLDTNKYECLKKYELYPTCRTLDRINDRFSWSAPSNQAIITPTESGHEINNTWQQDMWTCFTIYFKTACKKHKSFPTGARISNLIDIGNVAVPYLSASIDRKTKQVVLIVKIPKNFHPHDGKFKIYSLKGVTDEIYSEDINYDDGVGGYMRTINYPRKGWRYVISWKL